MNVVELFAKLGLKVDDAGFKKGEAAIGGMRTMLAGFGLSLAAVKGAIEVLIADTASHALETSKAAQRVGMARERFQELSAAAEHSGISADTFETSMKFLSRSMYEATHGSKELHQAFRVLGVEVNRSSKAGDVFERLVAKFSTMPEGPEKVALAMRLFGRAGNELLPFLNKGNAAIAEMVMEAHELGLVFTDEDVAAAKAYKKSNKELAESLEGLKLTIGKALLREAGGWQKALARWIKLNREWIASSIHKGVEYLGRAIKWLKQIAEPFVKILGWMVSQTWILKAATAALAVMLAVSLGGAIRDAAHALGVMITRILALDAAQLAGAATAAAWALAWVVGLALVMLAVEDINAFLEGNDSVIGTYGLRYTKWLDEMLKVDPTDSPLMGGLKAIARVIFDLQGAMQKLDQWIRSDSVLANTLAGASATGQWALSSMASVLPGQMGNEAGARAAARAKEMRFYGGRLALDDRGKEAWGWNAEFNPQASTTSAVTMPTTAPAVNVKIGDVTVGASLPEGLSPDEFVKRLGAEVVTQSDLRNMLDATHAAVTN